MNRSHPDLQGLKERWPSGIVSRDKISEFSGGLLCARSMANLDAKGLGPKGRIRMGNKKIGYPVDSLIEWLEERSVAVED